MRFITFMVLLVSVCVWLMPACSTSAAEVQHPIPLNGFSRHDTDLMLACTPPGTSYAEVVHFLQRDLQSRSRGQAWLINQKFKLVAQSLRSGFTSNGQLRHDLKPGVGSYTMMIFFGRFNQGFLGLKSFGVCAEFAFDRNKRLVTLVCDNML